MSMGITEMTSLISSQNTMKRMETILATRTSVNGSIGIATSEIKQDQARGKDTSKKEEALAAMEEKLQIMDENMATGMQELNDKIEADREKIHDEEVEQARMEKAAQEKAAYTSKDAVATPPAAILELSEDYIASIGTPVEQATEFGKSSENKSDVVNVPTKAESSLPVDINAKIAITAYNKGKSTGF